MKKISKLLIFFLVILSSRMSAQDLAQKIGRCIDNSSSESWIKGFFLYSEVLDCMNINSGFKKMDFYDISILEKVSKIKIDLSNAINIECRPELSDCYTLGSKNFIHVNPEFIDWLDKTFVSTNSKSVSEMMSDIYKRNHSETLRRAMLVYIYLHKKNFSKQVNLYKQSLENGREMVDYLDITYREPIQELFKNDEIAYYAIFDVGFWLRRGIDGTANNIYNLGIKILKKYDTEWFELHKSIFINQ